MAVESVLRHASRFAKFLDLHLGNRFERRELIDGTAKPFAGSAVSGVHSFIIAFSIYLT
jgi:hypothetical protein